VKQLAEQTAGLQQLITGPTGTLTGLSQYHKDNSSSSSVQASRVTPHKAASTAAALRPRARANMSRDMRDGSGGDGGGEAAGAMRERRGDTSHRSHDQSGAPRNRDGDHPDTEALSTVMSNVDSDDDDTELEALERALKSELKAASTGAVGAAGLGDDGLGDKEQFLARLAQQAGVLFEKPTGKSLFRSAVIGVIFIDRARRNVIVKSLTRRAFHVGGFALRLVADKASVKRAHANADN